MFRWLGKFNIATQLTLLLALVTGLAIFVVSQAAEGRSERLILERSRSSLADECLLRGFDLREAVRSLTREFRLLAEELEKAGTKAGPQRSAKLKEIFKKLRNPHDEVSPEILFEVGMAELKSSGEVSIA
ncbi:MAG: hypothetical protein ACKO23_13850, partial [Gemmataceae bacterium]